MEELFVTPIGLVGFTGMQSQVMHDDYLLQCVADHDKYHKEWLSQCCSKER